MLNSALTILYGGCTPQEIQALLPKKLEAISSIANSCQTEADSVVRDFERVIETLTELQKSTLEMQGKTEEAMALNEEKAKIEKEDIAHWQARKKENEVAIEQVKKQVEQARADWKDTLDAMPSAGTLVGLAVVDGVTSVIGTLASTYQMAKTTTLGLANTVSTGITGVLSGRESSGVNSGNSLNGVHSGGARFNAPETAVVEDIGLSNIANVSANFIANLESFFTVENGQVRWAPETQEGKQCAVQILANLQKQLQRVSDVQGNDENKRKLKKLIEDGLKVAAGVQRKSLSVNETTSLFNNLQTCLSEINFLRAEERKRLGLSQFHRPGPEAPQAPQAPQGQSKGLVGTAVEQAHIKVEMTRAELKSLREQEEKTNAQFMETQKQLRESMMRFESFKQIAANSKEILEVIQEGVDAFAKLKYQWCELKMFFDSMANLIKASLSPQMNQFVIEAGAMQGVETTSPLSKEAVYQTAYQAAKVGHVVHHLSDSYCSISKTYLMPLTMKLNELLSLNKDRDAGKITIQRSSLGAEAEQAQSAIRDIIKRKHDAFEVAVDTRMNAIESELRQLALPPIPASRQTEIKQRTEEVVEKVNEERKNFLEFC